MREGIVSVIAAQLSMALAGQAGTGKEAVRLYRELRPDVTLMDMRLPDIHGVEALASIRAEFPNARVIMISTFQNDVEIRRALDAGARGFLFKSAQPGDLVAAIAQVHAGRKYVSPEVATVLAEFLTESDLTAREVEILQMIAQGNRNRDVASALQISEATVKVHMKHTMDKLGAADRTEAVVIALRRGIISI